MERDKMNIHNDNDGNQSKLDQNLDKKFAKSAKIINKEQMRKLVLCAKEIIIANLLNKKIEPHEVELNELVPNPYNRAINRDSVDETKNKIKESGLIKPIIYIELDPHTLAHPFKETKKPTKMIIDGHHRWEALKELGHQTAPGIKATNGILTSDKEKEVDVGKGFATDVTVGIGAALAAQGAMAGIDYLRGKFKKPKKLKLPKIPGVSTISAEDDTLAMAMSPEDVAKAAKKYLSMISKVEFEGDTRDLINPESVKAIGDKLGVNWDKINLEQLTQGARVELEHSDVTGGDLEATVRIALAHIDELPDYYDRLKEMEQAVKDELSTEKMQKDAASSAVKPREKGKKVIRDTQVYKLFLSLAINAPYLFKRILEKAARQGVEFRPDDEKQQPPNKETQPTDKEPQPTSKEPQFPKENPVTEKPQTTDEQPVEASSEIEATPKVEAVPEVEPAIEIEPTPDVAQANTQEQQQQMAQIETDLQAAQQTLMEIQRIAHEQGLLTEEELKNIIEPLRRETEMLLASFKGQYQSRQMLQQTPGPRRQVGTAERSLEQPSTTWTERGTEVGDIKKQSESKVPPTTIASKPMITPQFKQRLMGSLIEGIASGIAGQSEKAEGLEINDVTKDRGWRGDPEGHAEAARERWEQEGIPPGGKAEPTKPKESMPVSIATKLGVETTRVARKTGRAMGSIAADTIASVGMDILGTVAGILIWRYLEKKPLNPALLGGIALAQTRRGIKTLMATKRIAELKTVVNLVRLKQQAKSLGWLTGAVAGTTAVGTAAAGKVVAGKVAAVAEAGVARAVASKIPALSTAAIAGGGLKTALRPAKKLAQNIFNSTLLTGGAMVSLSGAIPKTGFSVSPYKMKEVIIPKAKFSTKDVSTYIERNMDVLSKPNHHVGSWHNTDTGDIFLDTSIVLANKKAAMALARKHKQLAIYDIARKEEITVTQ